MDKCTKCTEWKSDGREPSDANPPHECPYALDLHDDDEPCTCCDVCTIACRDLAMSLNYASLIIRPLDGDDGYEHRLRLYDDGSLRIVEVEHESKSVDEVTVDARALLKFLKENLPDE